MDSTYIQRSQQHATNAQQAYENSLSYLLSGLEESKGLDQTAANTRYENLITQIRQQLPGIQQQFELGTKAAYINKQQNQQQISADLSRLGVNTQGFGVTQRLMNETAYGQAYGDLTLNYQNAIRDVGNQEINALGKLNEDLANLDSEYAKLNLDTQRYIGEQGRDIYNQEYSNYYQDLQYQDTLKQQKYENDRREKEYADKIAQQAYENAFKEKQYKDALKQQEFDNNIKNQQLKIQQSQLALQRSSAAASAKAAQAQIDGKKVVYNTANYCPSVGNAKAQAYVDAMLFGKNGIGTQGVSVSQLNALLDAGRSQGLTDANIKSIKHMFGL